MPSRCNCAKSSRGSTRTVAMTLAAALSAAFAATGAHADATVHAACFAPADLAARPGEEVPRKGDRRFDRAEPGRDLHPFAAVPRHLRGAIRSVKLPTDKKLIALT
ncbi:MAG: hypothetical protein ACK4MF_10145, partial [Hyphomicrobiaceae bacterium]